MTAKMKREPLATIQYLEQQVEYEVATIARFEEKLSNSKSPNPTRLAYTLYRRRLELLILRYSLGDDVLDISTGFRDVLGALERYERLVGRSAFFLDQSLEDYVAALWLVSFAILFKVDEDSFLRLVNSIKGIGEDRLLDVMIASRHPISATSSALLWPKPYAHLLEAIETSSVEVQTAKLKEFLSQWYPAMKSTYWHNSHTEVDGGFFGYWCIEAAGAAVAFGFNAETLNLMPHYPSDLVKFEGESSSR